MAQCSKCGSENVNFQREESFNLGGSTHSFKSKGGHGIIWWICIGWWLKIFKFMLAISTLGLSLLFTRKSGGRTKGRTLSASKTFNKTMAVCQSCGNAWKV